MSTRGHSKKKRPVLSAIYFPYLILTQINTPVYASLLAVSSPSTRSSSLPPFTYPEPFLVQLPYEHTHPTYPYLSVPASNTTLTEHNPKIKQYILVYPLPRECVLLSAIPPRPLITPTRLFLFLFPFLFLCSLQSPMSSSSSPSSLQFLITNSPLMYPATRHAL